MTSDLGHRLNGPQEGISQSKTSSSLADGTPHRQVFDLESQIRLGRIFGIKVGLHYSWFLIALLIVMSFAAHFHASYPQWSDVRIAFWALSTSVLFFASLLLHELAHSIVARTRGLPVREITLFALGGVSQIEKESPNAATEFWIAIAGPLTSIILGATCMLASKAVVHLDIPALAGMLAALGYINLGLAFFNMLPGYPMDGGRILRALIWWKTGDLERSTSAAATAGQMVGIFFIAVGFLTFLRGGGFNSLWIAFIGWFLLQAARDSYIATSLRKILGRVRVGDVMAHDCPTVDGRISIREFVENELLRTGRRCFIVLDNGTVTGLITPHEIKHTDRAVWATTALSAVMRPLKSILSVTPDTSLISALEAMAHDDLNQLPVILDGRLAGVLSRSEVVAYLQTSEELQNPTGSSRAA